jgi:phage FluMu gp28-like protein
LFPKGGYDHWRVVFPLTTRGYQVIVISTPRGRNTKFAELASDPETYSYHLQPITRSVEEGFSLTDNAGEPCTLDAFKRLYNDDSGWNREYLCEFCGDMEALIRWSLLQAAGEVGRNLPFQDLAITGDGDHTSKLAKIMYVLADLKAARLEIGWDVARHRNISSLAVNVSRPGKPRELRLLVLMRNVPFAAQRAAVSAVLDCSPMAVGCGDATGLGMDSNEYLARRHGSRWKPTTFTAATKRALGSGLATAFGDGDQTIPPLDGPAKYIATDLYAVQRDDTGANMTLVETENPLLSESHCDIAYSLGLARLAIGIEAAAFAAWSL